MSSPAYCVPATREKRQKRQAEREKNEPCAHDQTVSWAIISWECLSLWLLFFFHSTAGRLQFRRSRPKIEECTCYTRRKSSLHSSASPHRKSLIYKTIVLRDIQ